MKNLFILLALSVLISCNSVEKQWNEVQKKSNINAYESFFEKNQNSNFSQKAIEEIWDLLIKKERYMFASIITFLK
jgi:hypothetical protein